MDRYQGCRSTLGAGGSRNPSSLDPKWPQVTGRSPSWWSNADWFWCGCGRTFGCGRIWIFNCTIDCHGVHHDAKVPFEHLSSWGGNSRSSFEKEVRRYVLIYFYCVEPSIHETHCTMTWLHIWETALFCEYFFNLMYLQTWAGFSWRDIWSSERVLMWYLHCQKRAPWHHQALLDMKYELRCKFGTNYQLDLSKTLKIHYFIVSIDVANWKSCLSRF